MDKRTTKIKKEFNKNDSLTGILSRIEITTSHQ